MHWIMRDVTEYKGSPSDIYTMEFYRLLLFTEFSDVNKILNLCERITGFRENYLKCTTLIPTRENKENMVVYTAIRKCSTQAVVELGPYTAYSLFQQLTESIKEYDSANVDKNLLAGIGTALDNLKVLCSSNVIHQFFDEWIMRSSKGSMSANVM